MNLTEAQRRSGMRKLILLHLEKFGGRATARDVAHSIGMPLEFIWPRFTELKDSEQVRDTGDRIRAGRGRPQVVWALTRNTSETPHVHEWHATTKLTDTKWQDVCVTCGEHQISSNR